MEEIDIEESASFLCRYIREKLPSCLERLETEDTPLPMPEKVLFGVADISRHEQKVLLAIVPHSIEESEGTVGSAEQNQKFVVGIVCRGRAYDVLIRQMCRYAKAVAEVLRGGWSLGGTVLDVAVNRTDFYPDAGTVEKQMTVAEIEVTVRTEGGMPSETDPFE